MENCKCCGNPIKRRTEKQNNALHLWLKQYSDELNEKGVPLERLLSKNIEHHVTPEILKGFMQDIGMAMYKIEKTSHLSKEQMSKSIEVMAKILAERSEIYLPFPNYERTPRN